MKDPCEGPGSFISLVFSLVTGRQGEMQTLALGVTLSQYLEQSSVVGGLASPVPDYWDILLSGFFCRVCVCVF